MKKFLSYLFTFITVFAISTTITIKAKSNVLENSRPQVNASASSETTLLSGILASIENNPKLDISGELDIVIDGKPLTVNLSVQADLTTLTSPSVQGNMVINFNDSLLDVMFTYYNNNIYLSYNNIKLHSSVDTIKDIIELVKNITQKELISDDELNTENSDNTSEQETIEDNSAAIETPTEEKKAAFNLDLDSLVNALNEPKRTIAGDDYIYEVNLTGLCKLVLVCDNVYNIKSADISDFTLLDGIELTAKINVVQDQKLVITNPKDAEEHLDISTITHAIDTLKNNQYVRVNAWAAVYKQNKLFEYINAFGKADIKNNKIITNASLSGTLEGNLSVNYIDDAVYAQFNNLKLVADQDSFGGLKDLVGLVDIDFSDKLLAIKENAAGILGWLENNYQQILDTAIINNNQVKLVANLNGLFGQDGEVSFVISFKDGLISSIQLQNLNIGEYKTKLTMYVDAPEYLNLDFDTTGYYNANKLIAVANLVTNLDKLSANTNFNVTIGDKTYGINANLLADITNNIYCGDVSLNDYLLNFGYANNYVYASYSDINVKLSTDYIVELVNKYFGNSTGVLDKFKNIAKDLSLNDILKLINIASDENGIYLSADLSAFVGKTFNVQLAFDYNQNDGVVINLDVAFDTIKVNGSAMLNATANQAEIANLEYVDIKPFAETIIELIESKNIQGKISVDYADINIDADYKLAFEKVDGKLKLSAELNGSLCGLPISAYFVDDTIYFAIDNLKVSMPLTEIDNLINWVNTNFNTNLSINSIKDNLSNTNFSLKDITNIALNSDGVSLNIKDILVHANLNGEASVSVCSDAFNLNATAISADNVNIIVNKDEYQNYTSITNLVDSVLRLVKDKKIALSGKAEVYEGGTLHYSATAIVQVDLNNFAFFGEVNVADHFKNTTMPFMFAYKDGMWYVDYNNLKVKIAKDDLNEILVVLLELVGVDPSIIPFLKDAANGLDVDISNISNIVPNMDFNNPTSMIKYITSIGFDGKLLNLSIDSKLMSEQGNGDMLISVDTDGERLTRVKLDNLYTGVTLAEKFNLDVEVTAFNGVADPYSGNYIDLSGSNELIKAIINTAELDYFNITGNLDITVMGVNLGKVYIDAQVKLDEERKPEVIISLPKVPVIGSAVGGLNVNNDVPYKFGDGAVDSRQAVIYYKDGYVYMYRKDVIQVSRRTYEKKLKVHIDQVLADPMYYVQYVTGFSDAIIEAINKSLALSEGHTPNLGNIINKYEASADGKNFNVALNMYELTNDPNMGEMNIGLTVINTPETNNKNYVGKATFNLTLPFTDTITMILNSDDLALVNIGKTLDFSSLYNYISSYNYSENEEWEASNGSWKKADERTNTISFDSMGGASVDSITAKVGEEIVLPTLADKVVSDQSNGTRYTYEFKGWFTDERCRESDRFTATTMPRKDTLLYAKWTLAKTERIVTITFNSNGGTSYSSISELEGSTFNLSAYNPTKTLTYVKGKYNAIGKNTGKWTYTVTRYTFAGWYTDSNFTTKFTEGKFPGTSITLYAKWNETVTTEYYYAGQTPQ